MDAIVEVKKKVINDFNRFLTIVDKTARIPEYDMILHQIAFIQTCQNIDNVDRLYEYLMNN